MAPGEMSQVLRHLRAAACPPELARATDAHLLECFLTRQDEAAFALLVRRYGPMVWGVCRRALANHHDAEDAFQATFLVLARKAAAIVSRELLAGWLHGVAQRAALKVRTSAARRARERQVMAMPERSSKEDNRGSDLLPLLDREVSRLPDRYRAPIVLCDLQGQTRKEAARCLGVPEGTVAGRLARGRALLAKRLRRSGWVGSGAILAATLAPAEVPASLRTGTARAARLLGTGQTAPPELISAKVAAVTEGVLKAMWRTKVKTALGTGVAVGLLLLGGAFGYRTLAADKAPPSPPEKQTPAPNKAPAAAADNKLRDTLLVLDKQMWEAASNYDVDTLSKILADDYIAFSPTGQHWSKKVMLDRYRQSRFLDVEFPSEKFVIRMNEHTAIVSYEVVWGAEDKGQGRRAGKNHDRMISCWVQRDGGWFLRYTECVNRVNFPDRRVPAVNVPAPIDLRRFAPVEWSPSLDGDKTRKKL